MAKNKVPGTLSCRSGLAREQGFGGLIVVRGQARSYALVWAIQSL